MSTWFLADVHLHPSRPEALLALEQFLLTLPAQGCSALYILGDLFEYWLGDDVLDTPLITPFEPLLHALQSLKQHAIAVYFQAGNRDFLIGERFASASGMQLLADYHVVNLYGVPTLLMHGDLLCSDDADYQQMRQLFRAPAWQAAFLALPWQERLQKAQALRNQSQTSMQHKAEAILDVTPATVSATLAHYQVQRLIHGHTHRPAVHEWTENEQHYQRFVLGDWYQQGSALRVNAAGVETISLSA